MLNHDKEIVSVLPVRNLNGCYMQKTYAELIKEISAEEIDDLIRSKNPTVAPYASLGEVKVRITAKASSIKN